MPHLVKVTAYPEGGCSWSTSEKVVLELDGFGKLSTYIKYAHLGNVSESARIKMPGFLGGKN